MFIFIFVNLLTASGQAIMGRFCRTIRESKYIIVLQHNKIVIFLTIDNRDEYEVVVFIE